MEKDELFLCLSEREGREAAKEISLKIKSAFGQNFNFIFILFTPNYLPHELIKTFNLTLGPSNLCGIKSPCLIYKDRIIKKGLICCCINKKDSGFNSSFIEEQDSEEIELKFRKNFKKIKKQDINFLSFLSPQINPLSFLEGLRLSLGKLTNFTGAGYRQKNLSTEYFLSGSSIGNGAINLDTKNLNRQNIRLHNFLPLGRSFEITKLNSNQQLIQEINNNPAADIYKLYFEEKFTDFIKNRLFHCYPLGILCQNHFRLLLITDILEDGSLVFQGNLRYPARANIMLLNEVCSFSQVLTKIEELGINQNGVVFIINSLSRKKILGKSLEQELKNIQKAFLPKKEIFGIFADYYLFSDYRTPDTNIESGGFLLNVWE